MLRLTVHLKEEQNRFYDVVVAVGNEMYSFGGGRRLIDVNAFNTVALLWRKFPPATPGRGQRHLEVPSWREDHTAVLIEYTVYLWGGRTDPGYCNVLYAFDVTDHTWFKPQVSGTVPEGRKSHSACVLGKVMLIHGGRTQTGWTNDIYKLDTSTMVWSLMKIGGTPPPASSRLSAIIIGTKMFVFDGRGTRLGESDNPYVFDTETNLWMDTLYTLLLPENHVDHSAFTYNGELYIFGGHNWEQPFNDMWKFSPGTFSWKKVEPKGNSPFWNNNGCCCIVGDRLILFRGYSDLFILDFSPSLKALCKLAVIQYGLEQSELPHNIRWELEKMKRRDKKRNKK